LALDKVELRVFLVRDISGNTKVFRINDFEPTFADNVHLGLQKVEIRCIGTYVKVLQSR
jgi:hypothetical protein